MTDTGAVDAPGRGDGADDPDRTAGGRWWLPAIVVVGLAVRVGWALYAARPPVGLHDPTFYLLFGDSLSAGDGYRLPDGQPTAYYPVGYPGALGGLFWLADRSPLPDDRVTLAVLLNLVASGASIVFLHEIGRRLFDRRVALLAAAGLALLPNLVLHSALVLTETLFNAIALGAVLVIVATPWRRRSLPALVGFGVLVGAAALVRPPSLAFVPVLALAGWLGARWGWREVTRSVLVTGLAAVAVILPWTLRNLSVMEAPILLSSNVGDNLCIGNNPDATGAFMLPPSCLDGYDDLVRPEYEVRRDADGRAKAIDYLTAEPAEQLRLIPLRAYHTFRDDEDGLDATESYGEDRFLGAGLRTALAVAANVSFFTVLVLGLAAVPIARRASRRAGRPARRDPGRTLAVLAALSLAATPLAFFGDPRFHVPVVPFLLLGAAVTVASVAGWRGAEARPTPR